MCFGIVVHHYGTSSKIKLVYNYWNLGYRYMLMDFHNAKHVKI